MVADSQPSPDRPPVVHLIGDSTMADKCLRNENPERGWGQLLHEYFHPSVTIFNHARDGRSSRSFMWEGLWDAACVHFHPGDWLVIQFGHNDQKTEQPLIGTDPGGSYLDFLTRFVRDADSREVLPVFATSIYRRRFTPEGLLVDTLGDYPQAMRELALELDVPLIDLHEQTALQLKSLGPEASQKLYLHDQPGQCTHHPEGRHDDTHLSIHGARMVARLFVQGLCNHPLELRKWIRRARRTCHHGTRATPSAAAGLR